MAAEGAALKLAEAGAGSPPPPLPAAPPAFLSRQPTSSPFLSPFPLAAQVVDSPFSRLTDLMMEIVEQQKLPIPRPLFKASVAPWPPH